MAWLTEATNAITHETNYKTFNRWNGSVWQENVTTISIVHYTGMTKTAADTYAAAHYADAGVVSMRSVRENDAGAYRVEAEIWTPGEWTDV
jgi:hypothetical protein